MQPAKGSLGGKEVPKAAGSLCGHTSNSSVRPFAKRRAPFTLRAGGARRRENPWWFASSKSPRERNGTGASSAYWHSSFINAASSRHRPAKSPVAITRIHEAHILEVCSQEQRDPFQFLNWAACPASHRALPTPSLQPACYSWQPMTGYYRDSRTNGTHIYSGAIRSAAYEQYPPTKRGVAMASPNGPRTSNSSVRPKGQWPAPHRRGRTYSSPRPTCHRLLHNRPAVTPGVHVIVPISHVPPAALHAWYA